MGTKNYENLNRCVLDGFARLLDLGATKSLDDNGASSTSIEEDIYLTIKSCWEEVGENIREAMYQYDQEIRFQEEG
jgi:hypothetical protein